MQLEPWQSPPALARRLAEPQWALFYSSLQTGYSGRYSLLACSPVEEVRSGAVAALKPKLSRHEPHLDNAWFGYIGYGADTGLEPPLPARQGFIELPPVCMTRFATIYRFDHFLRRLTRHGPPVRLRGEEELSAANPPAVAALESSLSRAEYLRAVQDVIEALHAGEAYQVNLTRKFFGRLTAPPDALSLFERLCEASPAPYSACLKLGDAAVLSSSPERFLTLDAQGRLETRPIKGSAPRHIDVAEDARLRAALAASAKDRAENLMIVDLMRNDFSRVCLPGSVQVSGLYDVSSFATIHHMASVVTGRVRPECGALDALCACFPPGSMTGAPKLRAMEIAARLEKMARGAYSGALGWFGGDGTMDLSVIIRTLIVQGGRFEFQVGGGVVADSTAEGEWRETMVKAEGIRRALGQEEGWLENI